MCCVWWKVECPTLEIRIGELIPKRKRQHVGCEEQSQVKDQPVLAGVLKAARHDQRDHVDDDIEGRRREVHAENDQCESRMGFSRCVESTAEKFNDDDNKDNDEKDIGDIANCSNEFLG